MGAKLSTKRKSERVAKVAGDVEVVVESIEQVDPAGFVNAVVVTTHDVTVLKNDMVESIVREEPVVKAVVEVVLDVLALKNDVSDVVQSIERADPEGVVKAVVNASHDVIALETDVVSIKSSV